MTTANMAITLLTVTMLMIMAAPTPSTAGTDIRTHMRFLRAD